MPTYQINATGLDGSTTASTIFTNVYLALGQIDTSWVGVRFTGVAIAQGATISSATLRLISFPANSFGPGQTGTAWGRWYGDKVANAAAWSSSSRPNQISKTTAFTAALSNASNGVTLNHDVTAIVQELVNQGAWASGNAMRFAADPATGNGETAYYDYSDSAGNAATLIISTGYTLVAASGSYSLTGSAAGLYSNRSLAAASGSYALTGAAVGLYKGTSLAANAGSYALTGAAAGFVVLRVLAAASGSYALTGASAGLNKGFFFNAASGSYSASGSDVTLRLTRLSAEPGAYILTGGDVDFSSFQKTYRFAGSKNLRGSLVQSRAFSSNRGRTSAGSRRGR